MIEEMFKDIDFTSIFDNIIELYEDLKPKIIKRVYRIKGKRKYRTMLVYNPLYDLLPSPRILTMGLRSIGSKEKI